jgi:hypothetical protein
MTAVAAAATEPVLPGKRMRLRVLPAGTMPVALPTLARRAARADGLAGRPACRQDADGWWPLPDPALPAVAASRQRPVSRSSGHLAGERAARPAGLRRLPPAVRDATGRDNRARPARRPAEAGGPGRAAVPPGRGRQQARSCRGAPGGRFPLRLRPGFACWIAAGCNGRLSCTGRSPGTATPHALPSTHAGTSLTSPTRRTR